MLLREALKKIDMELTEKQEEAFETYYKFLVEYNEKVNLTAITDYEGVMIKHFYDSLLLAKSVRLKNIKKLCDVGSGAGFPSIPLKIMFPHLDVTIIESQGKRIRFLEELCKRLSLNDVTLIYARAEQCDPLRESYDLVTARAVARQNILNELCIPLVKKNGYFVSMKGKNAMEELNEGKSLERLYGKVIRVNEYMLPQDDATRCIIVIKHTEHCPYKYPRTYATMKKNPL